MKELSRVAHRASGVYLIVEDDGKPIGIVDIQDIVSRDMFGG